MEKLVFTREQAQHLQKMGLDMSDARCCWLKNYLTGEWVAIPKSITDRTDGIDAYTLEEALRTLPNCTWDTQEWHLDNLGDIKYSDNDGYSPFTTDNYDGHRWMLKSAYQALVWCLEKKMSVRKTKSKKR